MEEVSFTEESVTAAIQSTQNNKSPGQDQIVNEFLKEGGDAMLNSITALFKYCYCTGDIPRDWQGEMSLEELPKRLVQHSTKHIIDCVRNTFDTLAENSGISHFPPFLVRQATNAKKGPHAAYNAYKQMVTKETSSMFIICSLPVFVMNNVEGRNKLQPLKPPHMKPSTATIENTTTTRDQPTINNMPTIPPRLSMEHPNELKITTGF
ncbi:Serine palmitoyltransferase 2 [Branchiostoma belcheri]|nr:Serine palmitoyltransferase 2 [Branchiostoma belcheri]